MRAIKPTRRERRERRERQGALQHMNKRNSVRSGAREGG